MLLTDLAIRKLPVPEKGQKTYWEKGLGIRVSQGGTKTFVLKQGNKHTTVGQYPAMSLKTARHEVAKARVTQTPKELLQSYPEAKTAYLAECDRKNRPATVHVYRNYLNKVEKPLLTDITKADIDMGSPHAVTAWKVFFNWCIRNEMVEKNPFIHTSVSYGQRSRVLTDDEIRTIFEYNHEPYSDILKLCLLTGQRVGEVTRFQPSWIRDDTITIPADIAKNGREHTIPFNLLTAQYLRRFQHSTFNGFGKAKSRFDRLHPMPHWTTHDLRRSAATIMVQIGISVPVVEAILNHSSGAVSGVAAIYIRHNFMAEMRRATLLYEQHIAKLVGARA